jgi:hypothetical protein
VAAAVSAVGAFVLGAAPHVLHHAGPLAGAALLGGATGSLLFGALGLIATLPLMLRLRRRTGSWRLPSALLALFTVVFLASTFVVGPALTGDGSGSDSSHQSHHPAAPSSR